MSGGRLDDLNVAGFELPVALVVLGNGRVLAANKAAIALAPDPATAVGSPLVDWLDADELPDVAVPVTVQLAGRDTWVTILASPTDAEGRQLATILDATDRRYLDAVVDGLASSTFVVDTEGRIGWQSLDMRRRTAQRARSATDGGAGANIHPEDLPRAFEAFMTSTPEEPTRVTVRTHTQSDDEWEWVEMVVHERVNHPVLGGYLVQGHHLGDAPSGLEPANAPLEMLSLTETAPVGIVVLDPAGNIAYRNAVARSLFGPDVMSFTGTGWLDQVRPDHRDQVAAAFEAALGEGRSSSVTAALGTSDDTVGWLRLRITPQRTAGDENKGIIATIEDVTEQVEARAETERLTERLRHLATHDPLTSLPNRAALTEELERAVSRHRRSTNALAVLFCDLDGFKPVNDRLGHAGGDRVLAGVAARLRAAVRGSEFLARIGGDEFVVICEDAGADEQAVRELANRIHRRLADQGPVGTERVDVAIGLTIGVAISPPGDTTPADSLLLLADEAMYAAKAAGPGGTGIRWSSAD